MKTLNLETNNTSSRIDWIDISKAIAIIFIYFGHWNTTNGNLAIFAYSFHLQLFFIVSGFFATKQQQKKFKVFFINQISLLIVPFLSFVIINIIYFNLDGSKTFNELLISFSSNFTDFSNSVSPELWFLPSLFCVSIFYYILLKLTKSKILILIFSYILFMIKKSFFDTFLGLALLPFINFIGISSIPEYLFFYSLGSLLFPHLITFNNKLDDDNNAKFKYFLYSFSGLMLLLTISVYFFKPDMFINKFYELTGINNSFTEVSIRLIITIVICITVFLISYVLKASKYLSEIGKNTIIFVGFEFIIKDFLVLHLFPMFNFGIISLNTTIQVISISLIMLICVKALIKPLNKHLPFFIGKRNS